MNIEDTNSFKDHSRRVTGNFLQSVVAIDDQMNFSSRKVEGEPTIVEPDENIGIGELNVDETGGQQLESKGHQFHYQIFSSEFAKKGVVCGGFQPLADIDSSLSAIVESSKNADITILDWQMDVGDPAGELATRSICDLVSNDINEGGRLRLVAIYTAEDVNTVADMLSRRLGDKGHPVKKDGQSLFFDQDEMGNWKIEIVSKTISEEDFVEKLVTSFSDLTEGLLSNATLVAITDIRNKTHNLLNKFNKSLDAAYLSHVIGLIAQEMTRKKAREVALGYAVNLISEEIKSEMQISESVKSAFSEAVLKAWPESVNSNDQDDFFKLIYGSLSSRKEASVSNDKMAQFLSISSTEDYESVLNGLNISQKQFNSSIELVAGNQNPEVKSMLELSAIECSRHNLKSLGESHAPILKQGVVVKSQRNGTYYVCVQPPCDSVRISGKCKFTFLKVDKIDADDRKFDHVLNLGDSYLKLLIKPKVKNIATYDFSSLEDFGSIVSKSFNGKMVFMAELESNGIKVPFEWCGEFKQQISQSISNNLAAVLSRVGTDSFEWLRTK